MCAQVRNPEVEAEVRRIDARAADPDGRIVVATAMADHLKIHRNRLSLLRRQTGRSYGEIFVAQLQAAGAAPEEILRQARLLNDRIDRRSGFEESGFGWRPVLMLDTSLDHNAVGTFYSLVPQAGVGSERAALIFGAPFYRNSGAGFSQGGLGDVYVSGYVAGTTGSLEAAALLTAGFPTGDRDRGLGAGKVTADGSGSLAWRWGRVRPYINAGVANFIFGNVAYQRPFITDGNAFHAAGGVEVNPAPRFTLGAGAFSVRPFGTQSVISRTPSEDTSSQAAASQAAAQVPEPGPPAGRGRPPSPPGPSRRPPFVDTPSPTPTLVPSEELNDHGGNAWLSLRLHPAVSLYFSAARSVPFHLTTIRAGLGFNMGRLLLPRATR
jgi:hypothetical protein